MNHLLESKEAVEKVIKEMKLKKVALNLLQWEQIENIRDLLSLFANTVNDLEEEPIFRRFIESQTSYF